MRDLSVCPACGSDCVYPVDWEEADAVFWTVTLRCGNCERYDHGVFDQETVDAFDEALDLATERLVKDLRRLEMANMSAEIESFATALAVDAILPEDFR